MNPGLEKSIDLENNQAYPLKDVCDPVKYKY